jgi:NAD(P)-dependent dehydrogenase (short-subunit alcohol dehydrogenase family)
VGAKLALELARRGANVGLSYFKSREQIEKVVHEVCALGVRAIAVAADLRDPAQAAALVGRVARELGSLDALVNMASEFHETPFDELQPADFNDALASNLAAPYHVAVATARVMRRQPIIGGLQGKIVNFADWGTERPYRGFLPYFIAKGGVVTMTRALAVELAPTITVNAIAPAMIDPPTHLSAEEIEEIRQASPLNRIGTPADANNLVLYLLEGTDFATGAVYRVDGGRFLGSN